MKNQSYVVYINWDGFAWYYYQIANEDKISKTPVINELVQNGVLFTNAYTGIPSITNPMQSAIVSGAWPAVTGNCYKYYDKQQNIVIQFKRENKAETIAEAVDRQRLSTASIHQFILQDRGTVMGDANRPYIQVGCCANYAARFNAAIKLIEGKSVGKGKSRVCLEHIPRFLAIYMDDLDGIGHNGGITYGIPSVRSESKRRLSILKRLQKMDAKLGEFIAACKERGIYEDMSFVLTADHGMTPYGQQNEEYDGYGYSKLPELVTAIEDLGLKVEVLSANESAKDDTEIVLISTGLEVQLSITRYVDVQYREEVLARIIQKLTQKLFVGQVMTKDEMLNRGALEDFADVLISPKVPYHFQQDTKKLFRARGQHDSLDNTSQHIFAMMWGKGIKKGYTCDDRIYNIDFARTMTSLLNIDGPANATGQILYNVLLNG